MVTIGQDGARWVWHVKRPGMTWTSRETFATLSDAVSAGRSIAKGKGDEFVEPNWLNTKDEKLLYVFGEDGIEAVIDPDAPLPPVEYDEEADREAVMGFLSSLMLEGAIVYPEPY